MNLCFEKISGRLVCLLLALMTLVTFWKVSRCDFINFDDPLYVTQNPHIASGFTLNSLKWCVTADLFEDSSRADYWQPVTFLARALIISVFGLNPAMHHSVNLVLHVINTLLLFHVLHRLTGATLRCALVTALWAIHPQRVESVAWITEIKDLLCTFFWLLALWAYLRYVARPGWKRYLPVLLLFTLGLMSKPMVVTFPLILLVLDFWPLHRAALRKEDFSQWNKLFLEKIPLFAMALVSGLLTLKAQHAGLQSNPHLNPLANILFSYETYLFKTFFPWPLWLPYPPMEHTHALLLWGTWAILLFLSSISLWTFHQRLTQPWLLTGWAWFVIGLAPVVGLNDIATADRFTYLPSIGLTVMLVWLAADIFEKKLNYFRPSLWITSFILILLLASLTFHQIFFWKNSGTLFEHALNHSKRNATAHFFLGKYYFETGVPNLSLDHLTQAIRIQHDRGIVDPNHMEAMVAVKESMGTKDEIYWMARYNLALAHGRQGHLDEAIQELRQILALQPNHAMGHYNLAILYLRQGHPEDARHHLQIALHLNPKLDIARSALRKLEVASPNPS